MTLLFDKHRPVASPALAPEQHDFERSAQPELAIGLINNMPDSALKASERQFTRLLKAAAGTRRIRFYSFSLPSVARSEAARSHIKQNYSDIADLDLLGIDGLIVTGAEPKTERLDGEAYWKELTDIVDWASTNTRSTIWSCLAAHAAVLHLDGIERRKLDSKCSGIFNCARVTDDRLTRGLPASVRVAHSRLNALAEEDLTPRGYQILTRSEEAGVDIFARQMRSRFIFFQGHPEYEAHSLQREYMRDLARYLSGERNDYPVIPSGYFDVATEVQLARFKQHAMTERDPILAAELPGLTLRSNIASTAAATIIFRNWLGFLGENIGAAQSEALPK